MKRRNRTLGNCMKLSLGQAASEASVSKSTIHRAIKSGKISAEKDGNQYRIDPAELFRVFPKNVPENSKSNDTKHFGETAKDTEIRMLREILEAKDQHIADLKSELDRRPLLTDQRQSFWKKIFG